MARAAVMINLKSLYKLVIDKINSITAWVLPISVIQVLIY